jgi:hypothetical protein
VTEPPRKPSELQAGDYSFSIPELPTVPCPRCKASMPPHGTEIWVCDQLVVKRLCEACARTQLRHELVAPALASVGEFYRWVPTTLGETVRTPDGKLHKLPELALAMARSAGITGGPLCLAGKSGYGKTVLAVSALKRFVEERAKLTQSDAEFALARGARFVDATDLAIERTGHPLGKGIPPLMTDALDATLVVLDGVGDEPPSMPNPVIELINARHKRGRTTWFTIGITSTVAGLRYGGGVKRRIFEAAHKENRLFSWYPEERG